MFLGVDTPENRSDALDLDGQHAEGFLLGWVNLPNRTKQTLARLTEVSADGPHVLVVEHLLEGVIGANVLDPDEALLVAGVEDDLPSRCNLLHALVGHS